MSDTADGRLAPLTVEGRLDRVRAALEQTSADALVVTDLTNIRWCCGFTGSNGVLVIRPTVATLFTDSRYAEQAPAELQDSLSPTTVVVTAALVADAAAFVADMGAVALEADDVSWADQQRWNEAFDGSLVATHGLVNELRAVKSEPEVARMQRAGEIVDAALGDAIPSLVAGTTESELALHLEDGMRARGAAGPAYETIVASGPNAARPHARPTDRAFAAGDLVIIDAGAVVDAYRSDMTRTFVIDAPDETSRTIHNLVTQAQAAGVAAVRPGIEAGEIDKVCRSLISDAGYGLQFGHGTGHGVGLDIHELPSVRADNTAILQPGHVITIEPGIYLPGHGGVRVEDMVVVTDDGCRPLTNHPKITL